MLPLPSSVVPRPAAKGVRMQDTLARHGLLTMVAVLVMVLAIALIAAPAAASFL